MTTYPPQELLRLWDQEQITPERSQGHVIQHLVYLHQEMADMLTLLHYLDVDISFLYRHLGLQRPSRKLRPKPAETDENEIKKEGDR